MTDHGSDLPWTDEQWATVQRAAQDAARKARVASSFLPLVGPLPPGQAYVPKLEMDTAKLTVDDTETVPLVTISCNLSLGTTQVEDPELAATLDLVRRAAVLLGHVEDAYVFNGQTGKDAQPPGVTVSGVECKGGGKVEGLLDMATTSPVTINASSQGSTKGDEFVNAIVSGITALEAAGDYGPFACVLGNELYTTATTMFKGSLVPPSDRIAPLLGGGPLLRSNAITPGGTKGRGVIVALGCSAVDLVVASDVHVSYVQRTLAPSYVLRVSERFVWRIKQRAAVCVINA